MKTLTGVAVGAVILFASVKHLPSKAPSDHLSEQTTAEAVPTQESVLGSARAAIADQPVGVKTLELDAELSEQADLELSLRLETFRSRIDAAERDERLDEELEGLLAQDDVVDLELLAWELWERRLFAESVLFFEKIALATDEARHQLDLGRAYLEAGRIDDGLAVFDAVSVRQEHDVQAGILEKHALISTQMQLVEHLILQGEFEHAQRTIEAMDPNHLKLEWLELAQWAIKHREPGFG